MSVGKYSPTVSSSYRQDQQWWEKNGGGFDNGKSPKSDLDDDGYDSYGYSGEDGCGPDRAGYTELDYLGGYADDYATYERVAADWDGKRAEGHKHEVEA